MLTVKFNVPNSTYAILADGDVVGVIRVTHSVVRKRFMKYHDSWIAEGFGTFHTSDIFNKSIFIDLKPEDSIGILFLYGKQEYTLRYENLNVLVSECEHRKDNPFNTQYKLFAGTWFRFDVKAEKVSESHNVIPLIAKVKELAAKNITYTIE